MTTFHHELLTCDQQKLTPLEACHMALNVTKMKHPNVWADQENRDNAKKCLISLGTDQVLKNEQKNFDFAAAIAVSVFRLDDEDNWEDGRRSFLEGMKGQVKVRDMVLSSQQSTTKFFGKRAPCQCLDDMVASIKAQAKVGTCINCEKENDRRNMFLCGNCRIHQYCSKKCQEEAWEDHKPICKQLCKRFNK